MAATYLYVDASELTGLLEDMASKLTAGNFDRLMRRSLNEVGKRSKKIIREAIQAEYYASTSWINSSIHGARIEGGGGSILCRIPIISHKGKIGGEFSAGGGAYGWNPPAYRVTALIVKDGVSVLPPQMTHQGGQPPYRNLGSKTFTRTVTGKDGTKRAIKVNRKAPSQEPGKGKGGGFWTRSGSSRFPVEPMSGIAVPQMPLNRSRGITESRIIDLTESRVVHNFSHIFG